MIGRGLSAALAAACVMAAAPAAATAAVPPCPGAGPATTLVRDGGALESAHFDAAGRLLYGDLLNNRVRALDAADAKPRTVARVFAPGAMASLPDGDVVIGSGNGTGALLPGGASVLRFSPSASWSATTRVAGGLLGANGLARAADGTIYTSDPLAGVIDRIAPDGTVRRGWWRSRGGPNGLAISADGETLYASLSFAAKVVAVDVATGATSTVARAPSDRRFALPDGLAIDAAGYLYATAYIAGEVWRIAPDGELCRLARGLTAPTAVALGGFTEGTLYVTTYGAVRAITGAVP